MHLLNPALFNLDHGGVGFLLLVQKLGGRHPATPGHVGQGELLLFWREAYATEASEEQSACFLK